MKLCLKPVQILVLILVVLSSLKLPFVQANVPKKRSTVVESVIRVESSSVPKTYEEMKYYLSTFEADRKGQQFPLLLALHGRGGNGRDYLDVWRDEADECRVMVLAPTRTRGYSGEARDLVVFYRLIEEIIRRYPIARDKVFIAGDSSGALVSRWLLLSNPAKWKKVVFVSSPPFEQWNDLFEDSRLPPVLYVHGVKDNQFKIGEIEKSVESLRRYTSEAKLISYPDAGHEHRPEWNRKIFDWLLRQDYSSIS